MKLSKLISPILVSSIRSFASSTNDPPSVLRKSATHQWISPPVEFLQGQKPPTALSWIRRRSPIVSEELIMKLFSQRKVRFFDGVKVRQVKKDTILKSGERILLPLLTANKQRLPPPGETQVSTDEKQSKKKEKLETRKRLKMMVKEAKDWSLYSCDEFFVINKPEGIRVPYGVDDDITIFSIYDQLSTEEKWTSKPKLVHELENMMSGTLIIAKTTEAAFWLCEAFTSQRKENDLLGALKYIVDEVYWAILDARFLHKTAGIIKTTHRTGLVTVPSETHFTVLGRHQGLALVKLIPKTRRRHQLRWHCSESLNAPVLGDTYFNEERQQDKIPFFRRYEMDLDEDVMDHMYLHAKEMIVTPPGKSPIQVEAPLPPYMLKIINIIQAADQNLKTVLRAS